MNKPDEHDRKAAELLPCNDDWCVRNERQAATCPAFYRPAVAAALRVAVDEGRSTQAKLELAGRDRFIETRKTTGGHSSLRAAYQSGLEAAAALVEERGRTIRGAIDSSRTSAAIRALKEQSK